MTHRKESFSKRLSLSIITGTSLLLLTIIIVATIVGSGLMWNEIRHSLESYRHATTLDIEDTFSSVEYAVKAAAWVVGENKQDPGQGWRVTKRIVEENKNIIGSTVAFVRDYYPDRPCFSPYSCDVEGRLEQKDLADSYDYFRMEWFSHCYDMGEPCWSEPYFDEGGGNVLMSTYSYPLKDEDGKTYAVLTADILLDWLEEKVQASDGQKSSQVLVVSTEGNLMNGNASPIFDAERTQYYAHGKDVEIPRTHTNNMKEGKSGSFIFSDSNGWKLMVYGPLVNGGQVIILSDILETYRNLGKLILALLIVTIVGLPILFYICYTLVKRHTQIIERFSSTAMSIASGNFNTMLPEVTHQDEIQQLRDSFDHMQHSLYDYINRLKTTTAEKQRYESELSIARDIQMQMLTKENVSNNLCIVSSLMHPAREVGGDLYDYYLHDDCLYFCIGDVSGKGVPAALYMAITRAAFRIISDKGYPMDRLMEHINDAVSRNNDNAMFVTMFVGRINLTTGEFEYCNAGHNPGVIVLPDGKAELLKVVPNLACGLMDDFSYSKQQTKLTRGSRLVFYTDGVTEAERNDKEQYGTERLLRWSCDIQSLNGDKIAEDLLANVHEFTECGEQNDDITVLTIDFRS